MMVAAGDLSLVGGRDYPRTYQKFRSWFPDEWTCLRCFSRPLAPDPHSFTELIGGTGNDSDDPPDD